MNILFVIPGLGTGGAERSLAEMLIWLRASGVEATIISFHDRPRGVQDILVREKFDVQVVPNARFIDRVRIIRLAARVRAPTLVHSVLFEANLATRLALAGTRTPLLNSLVNVLYSGQRLTDPYIVPWRLRIVRLIDRLTARLFVTHFHAITHAVKDAAVADLGLAPDRITVIPRGRDPLRLRSRSAESRNELRRGLGLSESCPVLISVGRQDFQKGHVFLLDALAILKQRHPQVHLLLAGREGHMTPSLVQRVVGLDLISDVSFLGHREDIGDLLSAADVFVFPSLWEGLGGAVLEAMALSLPVVVSDIPPLREVLREGGGMSVPARDASALAHAIGRLLVDPDLANKIGRRGQEIFYARFTVDRTSAEMLDLYRRLSR